MQKIRFMDDQYQCQIRNETLDLDPIKVKYITRVYDGSPAAILGVKPGDLLCDINGVAPIEVDLSGLYADGKDIRYIIYRAAESKILIIDAADKPLGIKLEYSSEAILAFSYDVDSQDADDLYPLWQRQDWTSLLKASKNFCDSPDFLARLFRILKRNPYGGPAILTYGIALYETGEKEKGLEKIRLYLDEHINGWTTEWHALTYFYMGLHEREQGNEERANEFFDYSAYYCRCPMLQHRLHQQGLHFSITPHWENEYFPIDFLLNDFDETKRYQLSALLNDLKEQELLYLCAMPSYRANGPYNSILYRFDKLLTMFPEQTSAFHVITDVKSEEKTADWWLSNEKSMRAEGKPVILLYDEETGVADALNQSTSPNVYVLDKQGRIINAGIDFTIDGIWTSLSQAFGDVFVYEDDI